MIQNVGAVNGDEILVAMSRKLTYQRGYMLWYRVSPCLATCRGVVGGGPATVAIILRRDEREICNAPTRLLRTSNHLNHRISIECSQNILS